MRADHLNHEGVLEERKLRVYRRALVRVAREVEEPLGLVE
jgi:hypothetical protein